TRSGEADASSRTPPGATTSPAPATRRWPGWSPSTPPAPTPASSTASGSRRSPAGSTEGGSPRPWPARSRAAPAAKAGDRLLTHGGQQRRRLGIASVVVLDEARDLAPADGRGERADGARGARRGLGRS